MIDVTYGANASDGNPNPVKNIHDFLQIKMRKDRKNGKSTSRDRLNNRDLKAAGFQNFSQSGSKVN